MAHQFSGAQTTLSRRCSRTSSVVSQCHIVHRPTSTWLFCLLINCYAAIEYDWNPSAAADKVIMSRAQLVSSRHTILLPFCTESLSTVAAYELLTSRGSQSVFDIFLNHNCQPFVRGQPPSPARRLMLFPRALWPLSLNSITHGSSLNRTYQTLLI